MECDCCTEQVVIFFDSVLTERSARDSRRHRGILAILPFKSFGWGSYFRFLPGMMDICISVPNWLCTGRGISLIYFVSTKGLCVLTDYSNFSLLPSRGPSFFLWLPFLPFFQMIFPLLLDSSIFPSVENELVQGVRCASLIVLLSQW